MAFEAVGAADDCPLACSPPVFCKLAGVTPSSTIAEGLFFEMSIPKLPLCDARSSSFAASNVEC